jgi:hypothetical protein
LTAILLIGIGYLAVLPPFEGFDEFAYFSAIRETADTGMFPIYDRSFIDRTVEEYEKHGPMPWTTGQAPFDRPGRMTYPSFFGNEDAVAYYERYRRAGDGKRFEPGLEENWESQHPPLYYLLMAPIAKASRHLSLVAQIFVLRLCSYLLAWAGFAVGWSATRRHGQKTAPAGLSTAYLLYPLIVPMFFGEFARIGSDSLCLFLLGFIFRLTLRPDDGERGGVTPPILLGILFGLGLLTKAFFLPLLAGYTAFLLVRVCHVRAKTLLARQRLFTLGLTMISALLIGAGWYVRNFLVYGSPTGSTDSIVAGKLGGLLPNLISNFSFHAVIRDVIGIAVSWSWGGSWSLVRVSPWIHIPLLIVAALLILAYFLEARSHSADGPIWLPVWLGAPLLAGLLYHILVVIALASNGTPGWYLNILAPFLAFAMGIGIDRISRNKRGRILLVASLFYATVFLTVLMWSQMALFSGCAIKNNEKLYQFDGRHFCLDRLPSVLHRLSIIGWPYLSIIALGAGLLCLALAWLWSPLALRTGKRPTQSHSYGNG